MVIKKSIKETVLLDRNSSTPLFVQIAETLKRRILSGEYSHGKASFTGEELEEEFETSNITIRKALDILRSDGIVERRRGLGTIISEISPEPIVFELSGSFQKLVESIEKMPSQMKVIEIVTIACPKRVQNILSLDPDQEVWRMKRIRKYKGTPVSFYIYYADPRLVSSISKNDAKKVNFIDAFQKAAGRKISSIRQSIRSAVADLDISAMLEIPFGAPVFFNENIYCSPRGGGLYLSQSYFRGDMCVFKASVQL